MARPKEAILSRNLIRDQALSIIDEEGLEALTMRRLATRLGVQAASLYSHFANKDAVLDAIADRLAKRIDPGGFDEGWAAGLRTWANSFYAAIHWHPHAAPVVTAGSRERADFLSMTEQVHRSLVSTGWPPKHAVMVAAAVKFLVLGAATTADDELSSRRQLAAKDRASSQPAAPPLHELPDTVSRASFTLALDSLMVGFEELYASVRTKASGGGADAVVPRSAG